MGRRRSWRAGGEASEMGSGGGRRVGFRERNVGVAREKRVADCGRGRACERRRSEGAGGRRGRPA
jgi:hypothetical protein